MVAVDEKISETSRIHSGKTKTTVYRPIIEYEVDGTAYDEQWSIWSNIRMYHEGEPVK